ncbi:hypothetical protein OSB04_013399 [Centaurea solstitialis]|uniref:Uncharacterized protein n=1 Tax=Centaurea solstitialis TaxID=347529 RepID=A0AA38WNC2_9ASTR|nr:hypothetical protein OSB04_013399 [Centaurea solstitialis]
MLPQNLKLNLHSLANSSFIIEGMVKIQLLAQVKEEVSCSVGWTNLAFITNQQLMTSSILGGTRNSRVQVKSLTFLSHWLLGKNEMENGDKVTITIIQKNYVDGITRDLNVKECGVTLVYDDEKGKMEEDDPLGYYESWNHIIGGDLSDFQSTTKEYILHIMRFWRNREIVSYYHHYVAHDARYKGGVWFAGMFLMDLELELELELESVGIGICRNWNPIP